METKTYPPDELMALALQGRFTKSELAAYLAIERRPPFLAACAHIEQQFTEACGTTASGPCLESGCSAEGEICLQPLLHAGSAYHRACAEEWLPIFRDAKNRAPGV